jgi:hypothetical protein
MKSLVMVSPKEFILWLRFELEEAAKSKAWFCFGIMYSESTLHLKYHKPPDPPFSSEE